MADGLVQSIGGLFETSALWQLICFAFALVFTWSGISKLLQRQATARALASFGLADRRDLRPAVLLALSELVLAGALWTSSFLAAPYGAAALGATVVLLIAFTVVVARAVARGESFPCMCFGDETAQVSVGTVVRNVALIAIATAGLVATFTADEDRLAGADYLTGLCLVSAILGGTALSARLVALGRGLIDPFAASEPALVAEGLDARASADKAPRGVRRT
ncbi:MAG TPA: MauE/DoxX family redox-associated membrane protein [Miltoncostaeaceae bacterium]|jgi:hypothetical protein|nr:MauE/DoxX family redox-associated membrane protein [Miltoncostaeaceae bacterium]